MSAKKVTQGNMLLLEYELLENGVPYPDFATADVVRCSLIALDGTVAVLTDSTDPNVTLDSPAIGSVSWQLTTPVTGDIPLGQYDLAFQTEVSGNHIEWIVEREIQITKQLI